MAIFMTLFNMLGIFMVPALVVICVGVYIWIHYLSVRHGVIKLKELPFEILFEIVFIWLGWKLLKFIVSFLWSAFIES